MFLSMIKSKIGGHPGSDGLNPRDFESLDFEVVAEGIDNEVGPEEEAENVEDEGTPQELHLLLAGEPGLPSKESLRIDVDRTDDEGKKLEREVGIVALGNIGQDDLADNAGKGKAKGDDEEDHMGLAQNHRLRVGQPGEGQGKKDEGRREPNHGPEEGLLFFGVLCVLIVLLDVRVNSVDAEGILKKEEQSDHANTEEIRNREPRGKKRRKGNVEVCGKNSEFSCKDFRAIDSRENHHGHSNQNSFSRAIDKSQVHGVGVVFLPSDRIE